MMAAILAAVIVVVLIYGLSRYVFGRRLRMAGGRARQPRLGVIDAYDLDRQRQLVLVRRDNVEHLIMIGGPNDLLIESAFVRAQPTVVVPPGRDKEAPPAASPPVSLPLPSLAPEPASAERAAPAPPPPAAPEPQPASQVSASDLPQPVPAQPPRALAPRAPTVDLGRPVTPKDLGPLSDLPAPGPAAVPEPDMAGAPPPAATPEPVAAQPEPAAPAPMPPRPSRFPTAAVRPAGSPLPPRPPLTALRATIVPSTAGTPGAPPAGNGVARPPGPGLANRPTPLSPMQRGTSAASLRRDPPLVTPQNGAPSTTAGPVAPVPATADPEPATPSLPIVRTPERDAGITLDSIESLEEEMARLLGRAAGGEKS